MPMYRVPDGDLERCVADIDRSPREEFIDATRAGDGAWVVFTKKVSRAKTPARETR